MSFLNSSNKQKVAVLPDGNASDLDQLFTNLIEKTLPKIETVIINIIICHLSFY